VNKHKLINSQFTIETGAGGGVAGAGGDCAEWD
jgi:hypothetical protein